MRDSGSVKSYSRILMAAEMALWMVRAGKHGEHEPKFFEEGRIYLTWDEVGLDLGKAPDKTALRELIHPTGSDVLQLDRQPPRRASPRGPCEGDQAEATSSYMTRLDGTYLRAPRIVGSLP